MRIMMITIMIMIHIVKLIFHTLKPGERPAGLAGGDPGSPGPRYYTIRYDTILYYTILS